MWREKPHRHGADMTLLQQTTEGKWQLQWNIALNRWISKTGCYNDLNADCKCVGSRDVTACLTRPRGSLTYLLVVTESRLKFSGAYGRQRALASLCHLQWVKPRPPLSSRKCIWNTLLTFPLLMSLFIAPWFQVFPSWQEPPCCLPKPDRCLCQRAEIQQWWRYYSEDLICQSRLGRVHPYGD